MVIKVLNLDKCIKKFGDISNIDIYPVIRDATAKVQRTAKANTPVSPTLRRKDGTVYHIGGTLREGNKARVLRRRGKQGSPFAVGVVYNPVEYAIYVEFGTRYMVAQPFLTRTLEEHRMEIQNDLSKYLKKETTKLIK